MTVQSFSPEQPVAVTAAAREHFRNQLLGKADSAVRLSVKESGCTGFKYVVTLVDEAEEGDTVLHLDNGVTLYIDPKALPIVQGTEIDLIREGVNQSLVFNNPNVADQCGCGESFSVS